MTLQKLLAHITHGAVIKMRANTRTRPAFAKVSRLKKSASHAYLLTPGRYVGAEEIEDDGEPFEKKMKHLVAELHVQLDEAGKLGSAIKSNLKGLGYGG